MNSSAMAFSFPREKQPVRALPVLGAGILSGVVASLANELVGQAALAFLEVPRDLAPLRMGAPALATGVAALGAALCMIAVHRLSHRPHAMFRRIALSALALSLVALLAIAGQATPLALLTLAAMHFIAFAVIVPWVQRRARLALLAP
jgi:hypothetical protein